LPLCDNPTGNDSLTVDKIGQLVKETRHLLQSRRIKPKLQFVNNYYGFLCISSQACAQLINKFHHPIQTCNKEKLKQKVNDFSSDVDFCCY